jgi:hypothetical protein
MFQSLQPGTLRQYLGEDMIEEVDSGLNIALPLHQSYHNHAISSTIACLQSTDPEIVEYAKARLQLPSKKAKAKFVALNWVAPAASTLVVSPSPRAREPIGDEHRDQIALALRKVSPSWATKFRGPNPKWGEPTKVKVFCKECGFTTYDTVPVFHIYTGAYVIRRQRCLFCKPTDSMINQRHLVHGSKTLYPVEPILSIHRDLLF